MMQVLLKWFRGDGGGDDETDESECDLSTHTEELGLGDLLRSITQFGAHNTMSVETEDVDRKFFFCCS